MKEKKSTEKKEQNEFTKANVTKETNKVINKVALDQDKFVYQVIEDLFREKYPDYFRQKSLNRKATA